MSKKAPHLLPPVVVKHEGILVVRDDHVPGGTKRRVIENILKAAVVRPRDEGFGLGAKAFDKREPREFVYASPVFGYAQIALAIACRELGHQATVFCAQRGDLHPRTIEAQKNGAKIEQVPYGYLSNVTAKARRYAALRGATLLPFGLDCPELHDGLAAVAQGLPIDPPREVWCVAGSGSLTRALQRAWPDASHHAVRVGSLTSSIGKATAHVAPEKFPQDAKLRPPFPSVSNYDAKAWQFVLRHASPGALFWNVAG